MNRFSMGIAHYKHTVHTTVLKKEAVDALEVKSDGKYIDATFGGGGHTREILSQGGCVTAFDWDESAIKWGEELRTSLPKVAGGRLTLIHDRFDHMNKHLQDERNTFDGVLMDLGLSSDHLEQSGRGFTFNKDEPLDMRMDTAIGLKARDLLAGMSEDELLIIFSRYGEVPFSRRLAKAIVDIRTTQTIETTFQLVDIVNSIAVHSSRRIHPATLVFQALRIAVNSELEVLKDGLAQALDLLKPGGTLVVISFHSLEDRIVKQFMRDESLLEVITKKPITASEQELLENSRARSAKLRIARKHEKKTA